MTLTKYIYLKVYALQSNRFVLLLFSCYVVSNFLWPYGLKHAMLSCPSLSPGVFSNSCPLSQWCHPIVSCSTTPFSSYPQSVPASGSFPMSLFFASGVQSMGASASVLPVNIQGWFLLGLTHSISLLCKRLSRVMSSVTVWNLDSILKSRDVNLLTKVHRFRHFISLFFNWLKFFSITK